MSTPAGRERMSDRQRVFIADSCIGGLSVVKSLWQTNRTGDVVFLADYAINPLGVKSDADIAEVAHRWLALSEECSNTLVIACNTLSIRYHQLFGGEKPETESNRVISMVDCFESMVSVEADQLEDRTVLIIGTEFTTSQDVYPNILSAASPGSRIEAAAATELERRIARLLTWSSSDKSVLSDDLMRSIDNADVVVLACTCFPMARTELERRFPGVIFLDPGAYCSRLLEESAATEDRHLSIRVTGDVVPRERVTGFAESYLGGLGKVS